MPKDIFIPKSSAADALVGQLHTITYITSDKQAVHNAFVNGYDLDSTGWREPADDEYRILNPYFGFSSSETWEICAFQKPGDGANVQIRVLSVRNSLPAVRPELDGLFTGGVTISFPIDDLPAHESRMAKIGMRSTMGVKELEFTSPTGEVYVSAEIVYPAPENVYLLGVRRPEVFVPVGPIDATTGMGGAAYSARNCVNTDQVIEFLSNVLGLEIRRDVVFSVGEQSALLLREGTSERFVQAFAPGSSTGYLVLMDHAGANRISPAPSLGSPSRGIAMWSFMTHNLAEVHRRALATGTRILTPPAEISSPYLPGSRAMLLEDPDGFPIEVSE